MKAAEDKYDEEHGVKVTEEKQMSSKQRKTLERIEQQKKIRELKAQRREARDKDDDSFSKKRKRDTPDEYFQEMIRKQEEEAKANILTPLERLARGEELVSGEEEEEEEEEEVQVTQEAKNYPFTLSLSHPIYSFLFRTASDATSESTLFLLSKQFCNQLDSESLNVELGEQAIKNIAFISRTFINYPKFNLAPRRDKEENQERKKKRRVEEEEKGDKEEAVVEKEQKEAEDKEEEEFLGASAQQGNGLHWLLRRLSFMCKYAFEKNELRAKCIMQCLGAIVMLIPVTSIGPYLIPILHPLYRYLTQEQHQVFHKDPIVYAARRAFLDNIQLAKQVVEIMANSLPPTVFSTAYNTVRDAYNQNKMRRRQQLAVQAVANPEKHAAMKLKHNLNKRKAQKRKNQAHAVNKTPLKVSKSGPSDSPGQGRR
eukprot:TRINITY_DN2562_c0_g1_i1.p1 TRINITY_DN2562_c0_g1~~TRINITY_DN2562_c0_g1_i1.p1  ORF type:complete len:499 (+),score=163.70 TRINITY_DN2562_c0_g1_i1:217-1497(+)